MNFPAKFWIFNWNDLNMLYHYSNTRYKYQKYKYYENKLINAYFHSAIFHVVLNLGKKEIIIQKKYGYNMQKKQIIIKKFVIK